MKNRSLFPVAVHLFIFAEGKVLLLRRSNTGYQDGNYSVVAGHVEEGESVTQAAIREALEEVHISIVPEALQVCGVMHRKEEDERIDFFLTVKKWNGQITNQEPHKCDKIEWFPIHDLPSNTIPYVVRALNLHTTTTWFDEYGW